VTYGFHWIFRSDPEGFCRFLLQKEVFSGKKSQKNEAIWLNLAYLSKILIMGNIFLQTIKTIESIMKS